MPDVAAADEVKSQLVLFNVVRLVNVSVTLSLNLHHEKSVD